LYFFIIITLLGALYLQRVVGGLAADILPSTRPPGRRCLIWGFDAKGKLDCAEAFIIRLVDAPLLAKHISAHTGRPVVDQTAILQQ